MSEIIEFDQASLELHEAVNDRLSNTVGNNQERWQLLPLCLQNPEAPFGHSDSAARRFIEDYCNNCLYTTECLALGMTALGLKDGVYGGMTKTERVKLKKETEELAANREIV